MKIDLRPAWAPCISKGFMSLNECIETKSILMLDISNKVLLNKDN